MLLRIINARRWQMMFELLQPTDLSCTSMSSEATGTSPADIAPAGPCLDGEASSRSDPINIALNWTGWKKCFSCQDTLRSSVIYLPHCPPIVRIPSEFVPKCVCGCGPLRVKQRLKARGGDGGVVYWTGLPGTGPGAPGPEPLYEVKRNISHRKVNQMSTKRCTATTKRCKITTRRTTTKRHQTTTKWCKMTKKKCKTTTKNQNDHKEM